jgi:hypothetical protein
MRYITKTRIDFKETPKQSQNQLSIDPKTKRKKHQSKTKFTLQQI